MEDEAPAMILGYDNAYVMRELITEIMEKEVMIEAYVESRTLFDVVEKDGTTTEKRLLIDRSALKESFETGELRRVAWIPGRSSTADAPHKISTYQNIPVPVMGPHDLEPIPSIPDRLGNMQTKTAQNTYTGKNDETLQICDSRETEKAGVSTIPSS